MLSTMTLPSAAQHVIHVLFFFVISVLIGIVVCKVMEKKRFPVPAEVSLLIVELISIALVWRYDFSITAFQGLFLMFVLLYASCSDLATHEVDDNLWVIILALSLCSIPAVGIKSMLIGAVFVAIPQLAMAMLPPHKTLGGADIKLSIALAFLLGTWKGLGAYLIGLVLAVIFMAIYNKINKRDGDQAFALVPFLSVGAMAMFLI